ncbi:hypothetical protein H3Z83_06725 [Tenacibaculum sp. S7007]|uniref:Chromosome partitioning protein ParA n=1 Tax=Tenacibaculum pelagium TaxID=2759527 RepID=A0A839AM76_9FLAO|nr:hypothetical protein [Tenacibaculum pelagium]MBA6156212.1 hypothetical protein [Tenacibaculum pelagium]
MIAFKNLKNNGLIAFLLILILAIGYLSYQNAEDYTELKDVFEIEKKELESELNTLIKEYEKASYNKNETSLKLREELQKIIKLRDTIHNLKATDYGLIRLYRKRIATLVEENKKLFAQIDSLQVINNDLITKNDSVTDELALKESLNTRLKYRNQFLYQEKRVLSDKIATAEIIKISSIKAEAMKRKSSGRHTSTSRSKRTDAFKTEFNLLENKIISPGAKPIYIQITDENNEVISPSKKVTLKDKNTILCSDVLMADYHNKQLSVISFINVNRDSIKKGTYKIHVFVDGIYNGNTEIKLR